MRIDLFFGISSYEENRYSWNFSTKNPAMLSESIEEKFKKSCPDVQKFIMKIYGGYVYQVLFDGSYSDGSAAIIKSSWECDPAIYSVFDKVCELLRSRSLTAL